jgi:hypothetical protein
MLNAAATANAISEARTWRSLSLAAFNTTPSAAMPMTIPTNGPRGSDGQLIKGTAAARACCASV